ncbi:MAG: hypothetical protein LBL23_08950 [Coriobacteriales bacterium]|jgi:hypothetical protein|nr:hypothetical protein [Coriobacteriales bacterium]
MNSYTLGGTTIDSVDLKCLVVSRGVKVDNAVYKAFEDTTRLSMNPLCCNCMVFSDGTIAQLTDLNFHLRLLSGMLSWDKLKLLKYASDLNTPFTLRLLDGSEVERVGKGARERVSQEVGEGVGEGQNGKAMDGSSAVGLFHEKELLDTVSFSAASGFYRQKTSGGLPFTGNAVIQGTDWVAFQCLWPCEFALAGKPCEYCFSGADFEARARKGKPQPEPVSAADVVEVVAFAVSDPGVRHLQITGGSTFDGVSEFTYVREYLEALAASPEAQLSGEKLLYITPPTELGILDEYLSLGASRIACSLEVWDEQVAHAVTPGKMDFTGREQHLQALEYVAGKYGPARAFSNFIIGIESFETLAEGARYLAERGIMPSASVWMPMGRPVQGSMKPPEVDYYRRMKELFAELYTRYDLEPANSTGLNVCVERDIWNYARG